MSKGAKVTITALVGLLLALALGAFAYGRSKQDQISAGVSVDGVDVGGLSQDEARQKLATDLAPRLERPLKVRLDKRTYLVRARRLDLHANIDAMIDEAQDASAGSWFGARAIRDVTGSEANSDVAPKVTFSGAAIQGYVAALKRRADRAPRDAKVSYGGDGLAVVRSANGVVLDGPELARRLEARLVAPWTPRTVAASAEITKPKVATRQLAAQYPAFITINRGSFQLRLYRDLRLTKTYTIAVGQAGLETPAGLYHIQDKQVDPSWHVPNSDWAGDLAGQTIPPGPADPLKARWMGVSAGAGIHGTDDVGSLGTAASHGCIRMAIPDVIQLYDQVAVQTPVYIA